MSQEIELKLSISTTSADSFLSLALLSGFEPESYILKNTYYDTENFALSQSGCALRVRKVNDGFVQTLKTRGQNISGLHQREEWEMPIDEPKLNMALFPKDALPANVSEEDLKAVFTTDFNRTCWNIQQGCSEIELVLDSGLVKAENEQDTILELELELKSGNVDDLFALALEISKHIPVMPSDVSKAERGFRLCGRPFNKTPELPKIVAQQSIGSAFSALFGYEMEQLNMHWQSFWQTQQWRHLQSFLVTLGNMATEIDWFKRMMPEAQSQMATAHIQWIEQQLLPILSWWPACFALSQDAEKDSKDIAYRLQQSKAKKALKALDALQENPELGFRILCLTAWLHTQGWQQGQTDEHRHLSARSIIEGIDYCFDKALNELQTDRFTGNASYALSQFPAVHRLLMLCQYFDRLYGKELGSLRAPLQALEENLSRLSAIEVVTRLKDWLNELPLEQQASIYSWTRSQTVLLRDIKQLAEKLIQGRCALRGELV
jgi:triphosphatase